MRIVLLGDGQWATDSLASLRGAGHDVVAVLLRARPSEPGLERAARAWGLPLLQPLNVNAPACLASVAALAPDVIFSVAYDQILGPTLRTMAPWCLNVHAGKLPCYRGRNVINWALINGEREIGVTVHLIDAGIDTGDILLQSTLPIAWTDTYRDLLDRVVRLVPALVVESVDLIARGRAQPRPQGLGGTYVGGRRDGDEWLDWSRPSVEIYNVIRGISRPGPGARTWWPRPGAVAGAPGETSGSREPGEPVVIWRAVYDPEWPRYLATPGEVVGRLPIDGVIVKTGDSTILLREVQVRDRPSEIPRWPIGTRLGLNAAAVLHTLLARAGALRSHA